MHLRNLAIIINNSRKVAGSEAGGCERMGTMDYTRQSGRLSCKLHEGRDKATIAVAQKKKARRRRKKKRRRRRWE